MNHPKHERTLVIIKPDGIQRNLIGEIIQRYERVGLKLVAAKKLRQTVFKGIGYNMVNKDGLDDYLLVNTGVRDKGYDKKVVFNKRFVREINYRAGAHAALPYGIVSDCTFRPILYHFRYMDRQYMIERYKEFASRLSEENKANNWSFHYKFDAGKEFDRAARMCKAVRG